MKLSDFKKLIREEITKVLKEDTSVDTLEFTKFKMLFKKMTKDFEDDVAQEAFLDELDNLARQIGKKGFSSITDAEGLISDIQDGMSVNDAIKDFKNLLTQPSTKSTPANKTNTVIRINNTGSYPVDIAVFGKKEIYFSIGPGNAYTHQSKNPTTSIEVVNQLIDRGVVKKSGNKYILNSKYKNYNAKQIASLLK
jgi:hypothetical protein